MPNSIQTGASGSILNLSYGYNASGQMITRSDLRASLSETFTYDALNRLTQDWVGSDPTRKHTYSYLPNGNIDVSSVGGKYHYDIKQPHAVSSVAGIVPGTLPTTSISLPVSSPDYNAENKIQTLDNGLYRNEYSYGTDGNRYRCDFYSGTGTAKVWQSSKVYIGSSEFGYFLDPTKNYARTIIKAPTGVCAVYEDSANLKAIYYVHTDYQGSWLAISNSSGTVTNRYSYDAWGRPRNVADWLLKPVTLSNLSAMQPRFDRGYTGHEMICGFGLINMNGRLYDPYLQRFLSPDPTVQAPGNAQSYNRYSYCMNNPLMYTDPSGYTFKSWWHDNAKPNGPKESIKFVAHSMGAAYTKGMINGMQAYAKDHNLTLNIEFEVDLSPYQPDQQIANPSVPTYQFSHYGDGIADIEENNGKILNARKVYYTNITQLRQKNAEIIAGICTLPYGGALLLAAAFAKGKNQHSIDDYHQSDFDLFPKSIQNSSVFYKLPHPTKDNSFKKWERIQSLKFLSGWVGFVAICIILF
jgi:RHS repeat-associated protein